MDSWLVSLGERLSSGDPVAVDDGLRFLADDPYVFRSGYAREKVARWLARAPLDAAQRARARDVVLGTAEGRLHCPHPGVGRLAREFADNSLRRSLRLLLRDRDEGVAWRALRILMVVRRPGLTPADLVTAQALALGRAGSGVALSRMVARVAMRIWTDD